MGKFFKFILPLVLVIGSIIIVVALVAIQKSKSAERKDDTQKAVLVDTIVAEVVSLNFIVESQGTVRPRTETTLVSEVSGKIVSVAPEFVAGGFFREGEVLLQIDPSDYAAGLKRAEAALASRQAKLADETARAEQALKDWTNLGRQGQPSDLGLRKPQLADARANVSAAEADVQKARRDLERTRITVPYDGLVRQKAVDIGQYVTLSTRLGVTFAIDTAEVRLPLTNSDLHYLDLPSETEVKSRDKTFPPVMLSAERAGETVRWQARIIRTEGVVDETSRVIYAVAQVVDPYGVLGQSNQQELKIGTFVNAKIEGLPAENVVVLPRYVLRADNTILVANADDELEILPVTVLRAEPKKVYLSGGIEGGTRVVVTTLDAPIPGTRLAIRKTGESLAEATEGDAQ
ncbi:MAG: efflux RND transporter periplasmic adaptor subunit [Xanthomonadales bacterium]|nr:efflux RND transporter periplasmic adaptor subunit [Gammaproteobacteria bacterium]MBT8074290.1 efflux RND transporter periplasmic adaptor subunit [Gammaproteobacteria bacterium]MBT8075012.1 efflux RND transporter periplasmic adaptor subunit [Gammaproteobacteria bacterium]NNK05142.1 efflux RND transporter periplasmic adaptor subunit [Xanthomonadales bacterium]NNK99015.1 efflux RND transporter periplasmic adaptor subunit [Xanthomonadales bacterium]